MHADHAGVERDVLTQVEAVGDVFEVAEDLRLSGELLTPLPFLLQILVERVRVVDTLDVAAGTGVPVPEPGAAHVRAGLEHPRRQLHRVAQLAQRVEAGESGTHDDDIDVGGRKGL